MPSFTLLLESVEDAVAEHELDTGSLACCVPVILRHWHSTATCMRTRPTHIFPALTYLLPEEDETLAARHRKGLPLHIFNLQTGGMGTPGSGC
jgi:hypothetical protein